MACGRSDEKFDEQSTAGHPVSRREFLKIAGIAGAALGLGTGLAGIAGACGSEETTTTADPAGVTTASGAATTVSSSGEGGRDIKLGLVSPQTGPLADFAISDKWWVARAAKILPDGIVADDGKSHKIQIVVRDSQSDSNRASQVAGDLISNDGVDIVLVSATADTVNPVSDQCEAFGTPCISDMHPWQSYVFGRGGALDKPFKWTYSHGLGMEDAVADMIDMWNQVPTNKVVGLLWSNNSDGLAWADEETGMPPAIREAGFTIVQPGFYQPGTEDYTEQIAAFKKAGCEIQMGVATAPDFSNFWKQGLQQGYRPVLAGSVKALSQPKVLDSLGDSGLGLFTEIAWHSSFPFKDSLTGMTCEELALEFEEEMQLQRTPMMGQYSKFEWAVDIMKRTTNIDDKESILAALKTTNMETMMGPIDFTAPIEVGTPRPTENVYKSPWVTGQWRKGTKWPYESFICSNAGAPAIPVDSNIQPMVYSS